MRTTGFVNKNVFARFFLEKRIYCRHVPSEENRIFEHTQADKYFCIKMQKTKNHTKSHTVDSKLQSTFIALVSFRLARREALNKEHSRQTDFRISKFGISKFGASKFGISISKIPLEVLNSINLPSTNYCLS